MSNTNKSNRKIIKRTITVYIGIMLVWTAVWMLKTNFVDGNLPWFTTSTGSFIWWTIAKVLIWIIPALYLIRCSGRTLKEVFNFSNWKSALCWGGGIGLAIALTGFIPAYLEGRPLLPTSFSLPLFSVLIIAPTFEEFLARGALMGNLQKGFTFWIANLISSLMFVGMHIPGWYFMGTLMDNLSMPIGGALSIFLLGLAFGYATYRSRSVTAGMLAHFLNNLAPNV